MKWKDWKAKIVADTEVQGAHKRFFVHFWDCETFVKVVLFIREINENQNIDQGKQYSGTIIIDVSTEDKNGAITGCVGDDC